MDYLMPYNREKAVEYADTWAMGRNPAYYDYSNLGGDCTNFISQCLYAGGGIMNYTRDLGWYYNNANDKAPAWTGVSYLYSFLTRKTGGPGPIGQETDVSDVEIGDIIQLAFQESGRFSHSLIIVKCSHPPDINNILINTHSYDRRDYSLNKYFWSRIRFIKILGTRI
ncbi:MAG: amidase domain-containing protein [Caldicoprobacterales bacterium]|jgi:hypothetical protein|nr:amidase domain-containing protein [Clostridiales bacterium]